MTEILAYHSKTSDLALLDSDGQYWIGSYDPHLTHQNGEPLYVFVDGDFKTLKEGLDRLKQLTGNEF